jgi:hypothetical protein
MMLLLSLQKYWDGDPQGSRESPKRNLVIEDNVCDKSGLKEQDKSIPGLSSLFDSSITITITSCLGICLIDCFTIVKMVQSYESRQ